MNCMRRCRRWRSCARRRPGRRARAGSALRLRRAARVRLRPLQGQALAPSRRACAVLALEVARPSPCGEEAVRRAPPSCSRSEREARARRRRRRSATRCPSTPWRAVSLPRGGLPCCRPGSGCAYSSRRARVAGHQQRHRDRRLAVAAGRRRQEVAVPDAFLLAPARVFQLGGIAQAHAVLAVEVREERLAAPRGRPAGRSSTAASRPGDRPARRRYSRR